MDTLRSEPRDVAEVAFDLKRLQHVNSNAREIVMEEAIMLCRPCIQTKAAIYGLQGADGDDFQQMVLTQIFRKIDTLEDPSRFISWVNTVTARMAINFQKRKKVLHTFGDSRIEEMTAAHTREPWQQISDSETASTLRRKTSLLSDIDAEIIDLACFKELSMQEIAELLDKPIGTIKRRLNTARGKMKKLFNEND